MPFGSVKTNIGHLEAAAGIAGLIKTALALHHRAIPPSLHFSEPNPHVAFDALPLRVQCNLEAWPENGRPAIAGVSSFGFGGTNAHLVMEEVLPRDETSRLDGENGREPEEVVFPLSARSPAALWALASSFRDALASGACDADIRDLAYTAGARRGHHDHRLALVRHEPRRDHRGSRFLPARRAAPEQRPRPKTLRATSSTGLRIVAAWRPLAAAPAVP